MNIILHDSHRNMSSKIFLQRNLTYMRHRISRTNQCRKSFKVDSMLLMKTRIVYQFLYNNSRMQTESYDFRCPWCSVNCKSLYPLVKHLTLCHDQFIFHYAPIEGGARIDVRVNDTCDESDDDLLAPMRMSGTTTLKKRTVATQILVCHPCRRNNITMSMSEFLGIEENEGGSQTLYVTETTPNIADVTVRRSSNMSMSEVLEIEVNEGGSQTLNVTDRRVLEIEEDEGIFQTSNITEHASNVTDRRSNIIIEEDELEPQRPNIAVGNRTYYHPKTGLPILPNEFDYDSDAETDPSWLQKEMNKNVDKFTDVNEGVKEIMKMWNLHMLKYR